MKRYFKDVALSWRDYNEIVERICKHYNIKIKYRKYNNYKYKTTENILGKANRKQRCIKIKRVTNMARFFVALHEIAHILAPKYSEDKIERITASWFTKQGFITPFKTRCLKDEDKAVVYFDWYVPRKTATSSSVCPKN